MLREPFFKCFICHCSSSLESHRMLASDQTRARQNISLTM
uniref:Uncharacterized protein n=1 Tax=Anguilla anguilla TaxID=7936 RepID=A0A0E9T6W8_ANGAN